MIVMLPPAESLAGPVNGLIVPSPDARTDDL
jgi:hypothetical protein